MFQLWGPWCTGWGRWWDESHQNNSGSGSFSSEGLWVSTVLCLNFMSFVHSLLQLLFSYRRYRGKIVAKMSVSHPPAPSNNSSLKNVMCLSKISLKLINKGIWAFLDQWWCFIVISEVRIFKGQSSNKKNMKESSRERNSAKKKEEAF